jgi:hypothetical protein
MSAPAESDMSFLVLEGGAAAFTLLIAFEMRRQQRPWRSVLISSLAVFATLTAMVLMWRGR